MKKVQENSKFLHFFLCLVVWFLNRKSDLDLVF